MYVREVPAMPWELENDLLAGWKATLDALPCLAYALRPDGHVVFVNRLFHECMGSVESGLEPDHLRPIVHPDDVAITESTVDRGIAAGVPFRLRQRIWDASGAYRLYDSITSPYRDASNSIVLWLGIATEADEQAQTLVLLAESKEHLSAFLDTVPLIVWTADSTGWIDSYNPRWYEYTGQTREEAAGWGWQDAHHPEDFAEVMRQWPHSIATGEPFDMEFRLRRHDGKFRWMLTRIVPLRDKDGNIIRWYGSNTDIDDQKNAQQRSLRILQRFQEALFPVSLPTGDGFRFDAIYKPAENEARVGGDWYDATALPDGRIFISVGDVTGHGIEAAAQAVRLRQSLAFAGIEDPDPARVLARVNRLALAQDLPLATAAVAIFDPRSMLITYALAGHPAPVIALAGESASVAENGGTPLGAAIDFETTNRSVRLTCDSVFAFYTDGITEQGRDIFAAERALCEAANTIVIEPYSLHPAEIFRRAALAGANSADDTAVLMLQASSDARLLGKQLFEAHKTWRFHSSHARAARSARQELAEYLRSIATDADAVFEAELVLGEILANTVEHSPGLVEIEIDWKAEAPRMRVRDDGPGWPPVRVAWPQDPLSENGRGLPLIYSLASDVVIDWNAGDGATIACTLPVKRALIAAAS